MTAPQHQPGKRRQQLRQQFDQPGTLADAKQAEPQREGAEQQQHDLDRQPCHGEQGRDHRRKRAGVAADKPARQPRHCGNDKEFEPEPVRRDGR